MSRDEEWGRALIRETERRLFEESLPRIEKCLSLLGEEEIWRRPNVRSNSVGNLVLHLAGNVRQWIVHALGGAPDERERDAEFAERGPVPKDELMATLLRSLDDVRRTLDGLDPATLLETRRVQGFDENGVSILVHVVEHFSYHVGQITWVTKAWRDVDTGYYAGLDLNAK
jgi:uncharacterized damage-inducible protein DinB